MVRYIANVEEWDALMEVSKTKLVVADFTATWCPPCQYIGPIFEKMAEGHADVEFVKVDVDAAKDVSSKCNISCMPTFQFYKHGGEKVDQLEGADETALVSKINELK